MKTPRFGYRILSRKKQKDVSQWHFWMVAFCAAAFTVHAPAEPITFIHSGIGSGNIGLTPFTDAAFTIPGVGDTSARLSYGSGYYIDHDSAFILIEGVGEFIFTSWTRTFVNHGRGLVGFSRAGENGTDLFNGPTDTAFATWDMQTSIGPVSNSGYLLQWGSDVTTDGGTLIFRSADSPATFQATVIPEPSTFTLLGLGSLMVASFSRPK